MRRGCAASCRCPPAPVAASRRGPHERLEPSLEARQLLAPRTGPLLALPFAPAGIPPLTLVLNPLLAIDGSRLLVGRLPCFRAVVDHLRCIAHRRAKPALFR